MCFSIAEEKNQTFLKTIQVKKLAAPSAPSNLLPNLSPDLSPDLLPNLWNRKGWSDFYVVCTLKKIAPKPEKRKRKKNVEVFEKIDRTLNVERLSRMLNAMNKKNWMSRIGREIFFTESF